MSFYWLLKIYSDGKLCHHMHQMRVFVNWVYQPSLSYEFIIWVEGVYHPSSPVPILSVNSLSFFWQGVGQFITSVKISVDKLTRTLPSGS